MTAGGYDIALKLAEQMHAGQVDKAGQPYIGHLMRVAARLPEGPQREVALLHDILEDTDMTAERLLNLGFSRQVVDAVVMFTHDEKETYDEFIDRVSTNSLATMVKIADLEDNMDIRRLPSLADNDVARLRKYLAAWRRLNRLSFYSSAAVQSL